MPLQIGQGQPGEPLLLFGSDGFGRMAGVVRAAGLDLDEDDRAAVDGHQVELAQAAALAAGDDLDSRAGADSARPRARRAAPSELIAPPGDPQPREPASEHAPSRTSSDG